MTTLAINDLAASKELDSKAMAGVSGGVLDYIMPEWFGFGSRIQSPDTWVYADQDDTNQANHQWLDASSYGGDRSVNVPNIYQTAFNISYS